jgi:hypothetical protein
MLRRGCEVQGVAGTKPERMLIDRECADSDILLQLIPTGRALFYCRK